MTPVLLLVFAAAVAFPVALAWALNRSVEEAQRRVEIGRAVSAAMCESIAQQAAALSAVMERMAVKFRVIAAAMGDTAVAVERSGAAMRRMGSSAHGSDA